MSSNLDQFLSKLNAAAKAYANLPHTQVEAMAKLATGTILTEIGRAAPHGWLSGVGKKGASVGARYAVTGDRAVVSAIGPLGLVENDTKRHEIGSGVTRTGRRRKGGRRILSINGKVVTGPVQHPGTKGKHPFANGVAIAGPLLGPLANRQNVDMLAKVFH